MVYRNPFLDIQAYDSSDDEEQTPSVIGDEGFIAGGDGEEEDRGWEAGNDIGVRWEDEDAPTEESNRLSGTAFLDDMERRYDPHNLRSKLPVLIPSTNNVLNKPVLHRDLVNKAILMSEQKKLFWKIKCTPGRETEIVFDIINNFLPSDRLTAQRYIDLFASRPDVDADNLIMVLKSALAVESVLDSVMAMVDQAVAQKPKRSEPGSKEPVTDYPPEQAFQYLLSFAQSETGTIPEAEAELLRILKLDTLPQAWSTAIGKAVVEPCTDADIALRALLALKNDLVPSGLHPAPLSPPIPSFSCGPVSEATLLCGIGAYHLFSAFTAPDISGAVYLEAYLGDDPQNTPIIEFLRQHSAVLKVGNICLD
ncbi:hypothetical protein VKT23_012785 [Stygiomarasmius scandens]|uniref:Uncharacterized protein n=1 Tax=Marasmiellus scandens TaxID=2682957 RepID=A0ABR1J7V2_9AGAR